MWSFRQCKRKRKLRVSINLCVCHFSAVIFKGFLFVCEEMLNANKWPLFMDVFWFGFFTVLMAL